MADYDIAQAFAEIENELIDSMMRNFSRHRAEETEQGYNWTQWQAEQLKALEDYKKNNRNKFGKEFDSLNQKIRETIQEYRRKGNADQEYEILQAIKRGYKLPHGSNKPAFTGTKATAEFFKLNDRKLEALIKSTTNDLKKAETAVLRMSEDKYRKAIFNAQVYANTGAATYEKAVDMACRDMLRAGLNCVEYKNGARHTLSNYAEMAIRTANKRAYLRGEGERRQARGISTVVVNRRRGGCSHCAKYVGKVYIDDVYSGGKASDGDYPLLSEAIEDGLFHPNCKDSTSTYYEGITTLKPVSDDELKELDRRRKLEEHKNYYDNQAEKNQRIADYSLDSDNKRIYQQRAKASRKKAAEIENKLDVSVAKSENSDIIKMKEVLGLEQAKKRDHKIYITDVAIDKVSKSNVSVLSKTQNDRIDEFHRVLLQTSKNENDSNEVAYLFDLQTGINSHRLGSEHEVNIFINPDAYAMARNGKDNSLFLAHNHPSTQDFSYSDLGVFLLNDSIGGISVVSNTGGVHILFKSYNYSYDKACEILSEIKNQYNDYNDDIDRAIVKKFVKVCKKAGILEY